MRIGEMIVEGMKKNNVGIIWLADKLQVEPSTVKNWESGSVMPGRPMFALICTVLGFSHVALKKQYEDERLALTLKRYGPSARRGAEPIDNQMPTEPLTMAMPKPEAKPAAQVVPNTTNFKPMGSNIQHKCTGCGELMPYNTGFRTIVMHNAKDMENVPMSCPRCFVTMLGLIHTSGNEALRKIYLPFNDQIVRENRAKGLIK
jgi:transcriptional regulator with XRE-family HTH domain